MLKKLLLLAFGGLLVIIGLLFTTWAVVGTRWIGIIAIILALLVILFTAILRLTCSYRHCLFITFVIISLGILLVFTGVGMIWVLWWFWFWVFGAVTIFLAILIIALGILLAAEC